MKTPLARAHIAALTRELVSLADPDGPEAMLCLLRLLYGIGRRDLPLGRLFEGHVDALQIIARYGSARQASFAAAVAGDGAAFGVWNADLPGDALQLEGGQLHGAKAFASGAGILSHALVTVDGESGRQLILLDLEQATPIIERNWWRVIGMRRSETHLVSWRGIEAGPDMLIGAPGDYVREPCFSGGAIRFAAVQAGGIAAVVDHVRDHLKAHGRDADVIQAARLTDLYTAAQAAADAVARAARQWQVDDVARTLAHVAAARVAVYAAGEQVLTLAQAAVGVQAMFEDHPLAAMLTDLTVYLRQPGPDAQRARVGAGVAAGLLTPML